MIEEFQAGEVLLIDKPYTWTSFDVVNKIRYAFKPHKIKVGHAGTLDPLATGLLVICVGKKTKEIDLYQAQIKEYTGKIRVGSTTPSFDLETQPDAEYPTGHITPEMIEAARRSFLGTIHQVPPVYSAIKVDGKRAYESARQGKDLELKSREVQIEAFDLDLSAFPEIGFRVVCSKGTYIRSLARDLGTALNSGAHLTALRRERIGDFRVSEALTVDQAVEQIKSNL
ncbi:tRNA pseudouridine(55) synthase TruB [Leadbetterella sp. DM7]|uniref:tRNA pseudouridine(55) synthase TruB n=1 Tax=Leadbetterella sp. DM7 TaxID=3235085 RepID=UPI00349ED644